MGVPLWGVGEGLKEGERRRGSLKGTVKEEGVKCLSQAGIDRETWTGWG